MRVPLNWLKEYVPLPDHVAELVERLTLAGLESAGVELIGVPAPPGLPVKPEEAGLEWNRETVIVGRVLEIAKHPDADKLKLVRVDFGGPEPKQVVTGAPNIAPGESGMKVVLGLRGTRYFYTDKDGSKKVFTLEPKALRGIMNDAMCMSDFELGISEDHEGIIILDEDDPQPGTPVADFLSDIVMDLDVLPNMARCLSLLGVAREVAALTGATVKEPDLSFPTSEESIDGQVKVKIENPALCARYSATIIRNVAIQPAPRWMRTRLRHAGMRPISNIVDITNYVMLEYGQPLHAFDYDVLRTRAGGGTPTIIVRAAEPGETLKTLDGQVRELTTENLVIADTAGPIALAGVMGGLETEVTAKTKTILLESASFDFVSVRKTARQFTLFSEASTRFSRGVHPEIVPFAAKRAAQLLQRYAGGEVLRGTVEAYPAPGSPQIIELHRMEIERILGVAMPDGEVTRILEALQFQVEESIWGWSVTTPPTRLDIQAGPADLIEELARIAGYDRLPTRLSAANLPEQKGNRPLELEEALRDHLVDAGLSECVTYSFSGEEADAKLNPNPATKGTATRREVVSLLNPSSPERAGLRWSLLPGLLDVAALNLASFPSVSLFEVGPVFIPKADSPLPDEPRRLALLLCGQTGEAAWDQPLGSKPKTADFYDLKGIVEGLARDLHLPNISFTPEKEIPHLHPGRSAKLLVNGVEVGSFGELHPKVAAAFRLADRSVQVGEFDLEAIFAAVPERYAYRPISAFPPVLRDIAVVVAEEISADRVEAELRAAGGDLLEGVSLFDVYHGDSIPAGTKSLAYALTYRVPSRQLSDKEVDKTHQKIEGRLKHMLQAGIRGKDV